jgi:hypothetical protein
LFRARAIQTRGSAVYRASERNEWLAKLEGGARVRAAALFTQLDVLLALRPAAKAAMIAEARRQPGWITIRFSNRRAALTRGNALGRALVRAASAASAS